MKGRLCAIALPSLRVEIAEAGGVERGAPFAVVVARPGGAVKDERSLLGNTRLDEVSVCARALGVKPGQTIAAARAKTAELRVRVVHLDAIRDVLAGIAEVALAFGAIVSFEAGGIAGDVVWCDVTGAAHLFATDGDPVGELALATQLGERVRRMGHACRVAIADGPRIAAAVARFAGAFPRGKGKEAIVVPPGEGARAMQGLPLRALPLEEATVEWLAKLGLTKAGDLQRLPRAALGTRLGARGPRVMQLLEGDDRERLPPYVPPEIPEERATLEYGITTEEALLFVAKRLADRLASRLAGRCAKATRLELHLGLDRGMLPDRGAGSDPPVLALSLPSPIATADELFSVLRARARAYVIEAPILSATLRATELVPSAGQALDLWVQEARAERTLPRLVAELSAELGMDRVGKFALADSWVPEQRGRLVSIHHKPGAGHPALLSGAPEPSRLLGTGIPFRERHSLHMLERFEAVEWWKSGVRTRNVLLAWTDGTSQASPGRGLHKDEQRGLGWVLVDSASGEPELRGWMD